MSFVTGNPEHDFFEQNVELKTISTFSNLLKDYSKSEASRIMWSIYLMEDPNSKLYRIPKEDRLREIKSSYYPEFDTKVFKEHIALYTRYNLSKEESLFKIQIDKLEEVTAYLKELEVEDDSDLKKILDINSKLGKMWENIEKAKKRMLESQEKTIIRAGAKESAREKRKR